MNKPLLVILISILMSLIPLGQPSDAFVQSTELRDIDGGWHEAIIITHDIKAMGRFFREVAGWKKTKSGRLDTTTLAYLVGDVLPKASGRYAVYKSEDFEQGWVRLIELKNVPQEITRSNAQAWDTGGIFSIMTRSANIEKNLDDAEALGWTAFNDPYDFGFGNLQLRNIVLRGPDGVNVAIYEWVHPKREDAGPEGTISKAFNSMQMVADIKLAQKFYVDLLEFDSIQAGTFIDKTETMTNFALPINFSTKIERDYAILTPKNADRDAGRVELMHFRGFKGRSVANNPRLSSYGISTLMFPVTDIQVFASTLSKKKIKLVRDLTPIHLPPLGNATALTISSPDGALLTFFELNK